MAIADPQRYGLWEAVKLTSGTAAKQWRTCLAISALYAVSLGLINAASRSSTRIVDPTTLTTSEESGARIAVLLVIAGALLVHVLIWPVTLGALSLVGSAAVYGDEIDTRGIVRRALDRAGDAIAVTLLTLLLLATAPFAVGVLALAFVAVVSAEAGLAVLIFGVALLAFPLTYAFVRLSLGLPVLMREGTGPVVSLRRSWGLVGGAWWWVFLVAVVISLVVTVITGVVQYLSFIGEDTPIEFVAGAFMTAVTAMISVSLFGIGSGVVYASRA